jgi:hypothetical protein
VADVLADFRLAKANTKEAVQSKLLFRKRMFRETDESITEPMFINLSYVQAQHDYLQVGLAQSTRRSSALFRTGRQTGRAMHMGRFG